MISRLRNIKPYIIFAVIFGTLAQGFALDIFSHTVNGAAVDLFPGNKIENTALTFRGFYGGQIQIGNRFLLNGTVSAKAGNLFSGISLRDIASSVNVDEVSLMYRFKIENSSAQWALFAGEYEPVGTDMFITRYFGTETFSSYLLEKQIGFEAPAIYPLNGAGTSFMIKYSVPVANAAYLYYNEKYGKQYLNGDFRLAGVSDIIIADFLFGFALPFEKKDANGNDVVMVVKRVDFQTGLTLLIAGNPFVNFYMQAGISRIQAKPDSGEQIVSLNDLYFLLEPRFAAGKTLFSFSFFYLPENTFKNIPHIDQSWGAAFTIKSVPIELPAAQGVFGGIVCASTANPLTKTIDINSISIKAVPFADISIRNGTLKILLPIQPLKYNTPNEAVSLSLSYTIRF